MTKPLWRNGPNRFASAKAELEYQRLCNFAAEFWNPDERNEEYERGQVELIRDSIRWEDYPPTAGEIHNHILEIMDSLNAPSV